MDNVQVVSVSHETTVPTGARAGSKTSLILEVKYSDGSVMYRCSTCGKEFPKWTSTFAHRSSHSETKSATWTHKREEKSLRSKLVLIGTLVDEVLSLLESGASPSEIDTLNAILDEERKARKKAETDLRRIRSLLSGN